MEETRKLLFKMISIDDTGIFWKLNVNLQPMFKI